MLFILTLLLRQKITKVQDETQLSDNCMMIILQEIVYVIQYNRMVYVCSYLTDLEVNKLEFI